MRLLLLFPNLILLAIAGYNLFIDFTAIGEPNYLVHKLLHSIVLLISLTTIAILLKPVFIINKKQAVTEDLEDYIIATK